ncbi:MAG: hypothetical protein II304_08895 [Bacteroidales bacterium]|nr:hypothetical protein [Bacteroidales bacterium]
MKFAGKLYSGNLFLGVVCADSISALKRNASRKCNGYFQVMDKIVLHRANDKEVDGLTLTRVNNKSPNNMIVRGQWH